VNETLSFAPLLLVVLLAFAMPIVLARLKPLRLPIVVGEILAGIIIGRNGLEVPHGNTRLQHGDRLTLVGDTDAVNAARQMLFSRPNGA